jgi:tetratricopeptide (TPR) repeat protein
MADSGWRRFWNSIKPPPAPPRREPWRPPAAHPSGLSRFWNAIKPPPAAPPRDQGPSKELRIRQRRLVTGTAAVFAVAGIGAWGVYLYIDSAPTRAAAVFQDGMGLMGSGDYRGAVARFTKAVDIWPRMASGYLQRGLAYRNLNQPDAATEDFEHAIREDSNLGLAHMALGLTYRDRGDLTRAMNEFTAAIALHPNADGFYQRGQVRERLGEHQLAIQDYDAAIHEQPDAPHFYLARALSRDAIGEHEQAEQDRRKAAQIEERR